MLKLIQEIQQLGPKINPLIQEVTHKSNQVFGILFLCSMLAACDGNKGDGSDIKTEEKVNDNNGIINEDFREILNEIDKKNFTLYIALQEMNISIESSSADQFNKYKSDFKKKFDEIFGDFLNKNGLEKKLKFSYSSDYCDFFTEVSIGKRQREGGNIHLINQFIVPYKIFKSPKNKCTQVKPSKY